MDEKYTQIITNPKTAAAVSAAVGCGEIGTADMISMLAVLGSAILTFTLIFVHFRKSIRDGESAKAQLVILKLKAEILRKKIRDDNQ